MRKILFLLSACFTLSAMAQIVSVESVQRVAVPENRDNVVAGISPAGDYLLITSSSNSGLTKYDLRTGASTVVTDAAGAGFDAMISPDGQQIVYRRNSYTPGHLKMVSLECANLSTGVRATLVEPTRNLQGAAIDNATAVAIDGGSMRARALNGGVANNQRPVLSISNRQLMITEHGNTRVFSPNGTDCSYLWAHVSPDATHVLYFVAGNGAWVCDMQGRNNKRLGILRAPQWLGNDKVVGMYDQDNGEFIYASKIVVSDLNGNKQDLTGSDVVAMYPYVNADADKIAFSTPAGEVYIINLKK